MSKLLLSTVLLSKVLLSTVLCSEDSDRGGDPGPGRLKARLLPMVIYYNTIQYRHITHGHHVPGEVGQGSPTAMKGNFLNVL